MKDKDFSHILGREYRRFYEALEEQPINKEKVAELFEDIETKLWNWIEWLQNELKRVEGNE